MNQIWAAILILAIGGTSLAQQPHGGGPRIAPVLIQIVHLSGDQYTGFRESCLLVHEDGRFHREIRQQESNLNRPTGNWNPVEVFEGAMASSDFKNLNDLIQSPEFRTINGTVGDPDWLGRLAFGSSMVVPHDIINILAVSVSRLKGSQVFEVFLPAAHLESSLKSFVKWVDASDKEKGTPIRAAQANNCAMTPHGAAGPSGVPQTSFPKLISQTAPSSASTDQHPIASGKVRIRAIINVDGSLAPVSVIHGINPVIDQEALDTVKKWRFQPARLLGLPIAMRMVVEVKFPSH